MFTILPISSSFLGLSLITSVLISFTTTAASSFPSVCPSLVLALLKLLVKEISSLAASFFGRDNSSPDASSNPFKIPAKAAVPVTLNGASAFTSALFTPEVRRALASILPVTSVKLLVVTFIPPLSLTTT